MMHAVSNGCPLGERGLSVLGVKFVRHLGAWLHPRCISSQLCWAFGDALDDFHGGLALIDLMGVWRSCGFDPVNGACRSPSGHGVLGVPLEVPSRFNGPDTRLDTRIVRWALSVRPVPEHMLT